MSGVLWCVAEADGFVLLAHRPDDGTDPRPPDVHDAGSWDRVLKLTPPAAASIGASLVAHAVELDAEATTTAVMLTLADARRP